MLKNYFKTIKNNSMSKNFKETVESFIETMVTIDFREDDGCFGHYPFQMIVETNNGEFAMCALALKGVEEYYSVVKEYMKDNPRTLFMSMDFPRGGDIDKDFVAIFSFEDNQFKIYAIPYNIETGDRSPIVDGEDSKHLKLILTQFKQYIAFTDAELSKLN